MKKIILIGAGGHCRSCVEIILSSREYRIVGIVDITARPGENVLGYPILGGDDALEDLVRKHSHACIAIGQIEDPGPRMRLFEKLKRYGARLPTIRASSAIVSRYASIGEGSIVMHGAVVNAASVIGENCILNTGCLVEHDVRIGNHCHVSTHAVVNGGCRIGTGVFVGSNAVLLQGVVVGDGVVIGAGSVVRRDVFEPGTYAGNPAGRIS